MYYIYKITNIVNNKVYIGKTGKTVESRFNEHVACSRRESRKQKFPLYRAINKYGIENFIVEQIEEVSTNSEANIREQFYIQQYKSSIYFEDCNGYNITLGGDGGHCANYEKIVQVYLETDKNESETSKILGCTRRTVRKACQELGIKIKPNSKVVKMYDLAEKELLKEFSCIREAIKYFKDNNIKGSDNLYRKDIIKTKEYIFKVIRE